MLLITVTTQLFSLNGIFSQSHKNRVSGGLDYSKKYISLKIHENVLSKNTNKESGPLRLFIQFLFNEQLEYEGLVWQASCKAHWQILKIFYALFWFMLKRCQLDFHSWTNNYCKTLFLFNKGNSGLFFSSGKILKKQANMRKSEQTNGWFLELAGYKSDS